MKNENTEICPDVAICLETVANRCWAATYDRHGGMNVAHFTLGDTLHTEVVTWRAGLGQITTPETVYRYVPNLFMEQTRVAQVASEFAALPDDELIEWLMKAAAAGSAGIDGKPIFESSLAHSAYDFTRLPGGFISLTEVPRQALEVSRHGLLQAATDITSEQLAESENFQEDGLPDFRQAVETRLRVIARYLSVVESDYFGSLRGEETIAFFSFTPEGVGYALWNPSFSFFVELGEFFHLHVEESEIPSGCDRATFMGQLYAESVDNFLNEQFYKRIVPEDDEIEPVAIRRVYWTASANFVKPLKPLLEEFAEQSGFAFIHCVPPMEEMVVKGLLLGTSEDTTEMIPGVNLANDLALQYEGVLAEKEAIVNQALSAGRRMTLVYVLLPVACAVGLIFGLWLNNWRIGAGLDRRQVAAAAETARLAPLLNQRKEYVKTLDWYESVLRQIIGLRQKQSSALLFAARLDPLFPTGNDFYVSNLSLTPGGNFELKGLARDEFAVSLFARQMEFATDADGKRYFSNLTLQFKQGSAVTGKTNVANEVTGNLATGVSGFNIKGNFAPAAILIAQESKPLAVSVSPATPTTPTTPPTSPSIPPVAVPTDNPTGGTK